MAKQRDVLTFEVDGHKITALTAAPAEPTGKPLIAALHGGTYTAHYFDVAGATEGSFLDVATAHGYPVVAFDRPGYGGSTPSNRMPTRSRGTRNCSVPLWSRRPRTSRPTAYSSSAIRSGA